MINRNFEKSTFKSNECVKKRTIYDTHSPSVINRIPNNEAKKSKLSSQTVRNLNRFAFTEKEEKSIHFAVPLPPPNIQNTQSINKSQSISRSQRSQSKVQFSQKALSSINDDDLNFDI